MFITAGYEQMRAERAGLLYFRICAKHDGAGTVQMETPEEPGGMKWSDMWITAAFSGIGVI